MSDGVLAPDGTVRSGLCSCGCGAETNIPKRGNSTEGRFRGIPNLWLHGHGGRGERARNWNGGRTMAGTKSRYVHIRLPNHPRANSRGYVPEHILVAEAAIGHSLPLHAVVHHFDGNPTNNKPANLIICNSLSHHLLLHYRSRANRACGHADWLVCYICKTWDSPGRLKVFSVPKWYRGIRYESQRAHHRECARQRESERWKRKLRELA